LVIGIMLFARTLRISLLFLCVAGMSLPQDPLAGLTGALPLAVGDRWIYDTEFRDGVETHIEVRHWVRQDTTMAVEWIPEGILIRRKVSVLQPAASSSSTRIPEESNILVRGSCIYYLQDSYGWDRERHDLSVAFRTALNHGESLPDACFPLRQGKTWSIPNLREQVWKVAGRGPKNPDDPISAGSESWRFEASLTSGDENLVWFQEGVGVTASRTFHHGTYHDERIRLLRFEPANSNR
jgi:hypothetical protein